MVERCVALPEIVRKHAASREEFLRQSSDLFEALGPAAEARRKAGISGSSHDSFNIFRAISATYHHENLHSDVLASVLDPNDGLLIGDIGMNLFCRALSEIEPRITVGIETTGCNVEREHSTAGLGSIDILISDGSGAIIVENKINDAVDQPNQLARYVTSAQDLGLNVEAVVYVVLTRGKKPPLSFSPEYGTLASFIEKRLVIVPAIDPVDGKDLRSLVVRPSLEYAASPERKLFLEHYGELLGYMGRTFVVTELEKELIESIYDSKETVKVVHDIVEVWGNRGKIIWLLILDRLAGEHDYRASEREVYLPVDDDMVVALYRSDQSFGYMSTSAPITEDRRSALMEHLREFEAHPGFRIVDKPDPYWAYGKCSPLAFGDTLSEMTAEIGAMAHRLREIAT